MKHINSTVALFAALLVSGSAVAEYSGKGGMAAYEVTPEVYEYHYMHGFTGVDAMGWDSNLQYAWSRAGAALTCNITMDKDLILSNMSKKYGNDPFIHDMNGVGYHHMLSQNIQNFCTPERVKEIKKVIPKFEAGDFLQNF